MKDKKAKKFLKEAKKLIKKIKKQGKEGAIILAEIRKMLGTAKGAPKPKKAAKKKPTKSNSLKKSAPAPTEMAALEEPTSPLQGETPA